MNRYVSYGGGVNSTALSILLLTNPKYADVREGLRFIMADTGDEYPETTAFVKNHFEPWLESKGYKLEWVRREEDGLFQSLYEYCFARSIIPSRMSRWCTDKFKIRPIVKYLGEQGMLPTIQYLGIHSGEMDRRMRTSGRDDIENQFPLCYDDIDQQDCLDIIAREGLPIPVKSGCFYCPHSNKNAILDLEENHPELFDRAVRLESNNSAFEWAVSKKGKLKRFLLFSPKYPLMEWIVKGRITKAKRANGGCAAACFTGKMTTEAAPPRAAGERNK